jgi:uncharacterized membrane protein YkvA (DUF1232 family)
MAELPADEKARRTEEAERRFEESIPHVTETEVAAAADTGAQKLRDLERAIPQTLKALWDDIRLLVAMLRDYVSGAYRAVPFGIIAAIAAAILYLVSPFDVIPDFIPVIGYLDDAAVLGLCLRMVRTNLAEYRVWKEQRAAPPTVSPLSPEVAGG